MVKANVIGENNMSRPPWLKRTPHRGPLLLRRFRTRQTSVQYRAGVSCV